jgi:hypothetical protein
MLVVMSVKTKTVLYELNAPVYLHRLSDTYAQPLTLATIPDKELDRLAELGVDMVWLMGVWERSPRSREIGAQDAALQALFTEVLPDRQPSDFIGSAYAVRNYTVDQTLGGEPAILSFRKHLQARGIRLMLDFVPNHTAPDHPWVSQHPEYYIHGSTADLEHDPASFIDCDGQVFANGRDPQFPAWSDVLQLNAFSPGYRQAAVETLRAMAQLCDGVRCDMAMLMTREIFGKVWEGRAGAAPQAEFWEEVIAAVRTASPEFVFMAETYWDTEQQLIDQGFDYCYDKPLYDRLLEDRGKALTAQLKRSARYGKHLVRFIENHDEERAAKVYAPEREKAAAAVIATLPGLTLWHDGQLEGYETRIPVHLGRGPDELADPRLLRFYTTLLTTVSTWNLADSTWQLLDHSTDDVICYLWTDTAASRVVIINYSTLRTSLKLSLPLTAGTTLTDARTHTRVTITKHARNLHCDLEPWQVLLLASS